MNRRKPASAVVIAFVVTAAYVLGTFLWHLAPTSNVSVARPIAPALAIQFVACLGSIGVPVLLWARYRLVGPIACAGVVLATWHLVAPLAGYGDMAPMFYVGTYAPFYVLACLLVSGLEAFVRRRQKRTLAGS